MRAYFDGQELFMFEGDLVFITSRDHWSLGDNEVLVALYPDGEPFNAKEAELKSATPEELEDWGI